MGKYAKFETAIVKTGYDLRAYRALTPRISADLSRAARGLKGLPVVHVSATPVGGGVAEMLRSQLPLERSLGLKSQWLTMAAPVSFFTVTKKIHNLLQGKAGRLSETEKNLYLSVNRDLAADLERTLGRARGGILVAHDPQPLVLGASAPAGFKNILRLHVDLSTPNPTTLEFLRPHMERYQSVVLSNREYVRNLPFLSARRRKIIYPAISPFTPKNREMNLGAAHAILEELGINCARPILTQVSRLDPWKDPVGVIRAYYLAKNEVPDLQLVLAGLEIAQDDPEAAEVARVVRKHARGDRDIHLFAEPQSLHGVPNDNFINALYTASTVVMQKSLREGFGLTVTEAMWKEKAVVGGKTPGISLQIKNGRNGLLVASPEEAGRATVRLLKDERLREKLGRAAKRSVQSKFLFSRLVLDHLKLYSSVMRGGA